MNANDVAAEAKAVGLAAIRAAAGDPCRTPDHSPERSEREAVESICNMLRTLHIVADEQLCALDALPCWPAIRGALELAYARGRTDQARESIRQFQGGYQCQA